MVNTEKAWYTVPKVDKDDMKKWLIGGAIVLSAIGVGSYLTKNDVNSKNDIKKSDVIASERSIEDSFTKNENSFNPVNSNNIETYVEKASRVYLGDKSGRGTIRSKKQRNNNFKNQLEVYTVNTQVMESQNALSYLANKEQACRNAVFALKGNVTGNALISTGKNSGKIAEQFFKGWAKVNKEERKGYDFRDMTKYPHREIRKGLEGFGNLAADFNSFGSINEKVSYLNRVINDIDKKQDYIKSNLTDCLNSNEVNNELRAELYAINAESGMKKSKFKTSGRGYASRSSGRFTR